MNPDPTGEKTMGEMAYLAGRLSDKQLMHVIAALMNDLIRRIASPAGTSCPREGGQDAT